MYSITLNIYTYMYKIRAAFKIYKIYHTHGLQDNDSLRGKCINVITIFMMLLNFCNNIMNILS